MNSPETFDNIFSGKTIIKALKSRDHTERMLKYLKLPIKLKS